MSKRLIMEFFYCCVCMRYRSNFSTEPLPSNDKGIFTELLPSNDKGTFTEPLPNNDEGGRGYTDTHRQQRDFISLLLFFLNKESMLKNEVIPQRANKAVVC
jgi:hypothetical protein